MRPKSYTCTLILRSSVARIVSSSIGISYCLPVRLSVMVSVLLPVATPTPFEVCFSVLISLLSKAGGGRPVGVYDPSHSPLYYPEPAAADTPRPTEHAEAPAGQPADRGAR